MGTEAQDDIWPGQRRGEQVSCWQGQPPRVGGKTPRHRVRVMTTGISFSSSPAEGMSGYILFFPPDIHCDDLLEFQEVKLTEACGSSNDKSP